MVLLVLVWLVDQYSVSGEAADEAGHQHAGQGTPVPVQSAS